MKRHCFFKVFLFMALVVLASCTQQEPTKENSKTTIEQDIKNIRSLEDVRFVGTGHYRLDPKVTNKLIDAYVAFSNKHPKDSLVPVFLYNAGECARGLGKSELAVDLFKRVYEDYPQYEKAPFSLFLQGFIYENELKNLSKARKCYNKFIEEYPSHAFLDDAKASIENLGKSPEELIKSFQK